MWAEILAQEATGELLEVGIAKEELRHLLALARTRAPARRSATGCLRSTTGALALTSPEIALLASTIEV